MKSVNIKEYICSTASVYYSSVVLSYCDQVSGLGHFTTGGGGGGLQRCMSLYYLFFLCSCLYACAWVLACYFVVQQEKDALRMRSNAVSERHRNTIKVSCVCRLFVTLTLSCDLPSTWL